MRLSNPNGGFLDSLPDIKTSADVRAYVLVAIAFSIVGVLWLLGAMWRREWVKTDLCERICKPISIRWRPLTYWAPAMPIFSGPAFKVAYLDPEGRLHKAYCYTSNLQSRRVTWIKDEVRDFIDV